MPERMIVVKRSKLGFDETVATIERAISEHDWNSPGTTDMSESLAKHGHDLPRRMRIIKLCQPEYAESILRTDPHVACLMPCSIAVWDSYDGDVYYSKMNTGLMGSLFGGNIAGVMGGNVAEDEHAILSAVEQP
jgi:uncharacterized protein (DUF302 family)